MYKIGCPKTIFFSNQHSIGDFSFQSMSMFTKKIDKFLASWNRWILAFYRQQTPNIRHFSNWSKISHRRKFNVDFKIFDLHGLEQEMPGWFEKKVFTHVIHPHVYFSCKKMVAFLRHPHVYFSCKEMVAFLGHPHVYFSCKKMLSLCCGIEVHLLPGVICQVIFAVVKNSHFLFLVMAFFVPLKIHTFFSSHGIFLWSFLIDTYNDIII